MDKRGLIRSDNRRDHYNPTGFKGVRKMDSGRFEARYQTYEKGKHTFQYLGTYETLLEAAQTYARKWRKERGLQTEEDEAADELELKGRWGPEEADEDGLIRNRSNPTGYKGVVARGGRFEARYQSVQYGNDHLGTFDTAVEAARAYAKRSAFIKSLKTVDDKEEDDDEEEGLIVLTPSCDGGRRLSAQARSEITLRLLRRGEDGDAGLQCARR